MPEQRLPNVTVRTNEYLPDPDVKVSHNEWYAVSWEMDFGKQVDEHKATRSAENNQNDDTHDVAPTSPDFSNHTTDVGDNPYIRRSPPTESPPIPPKSPPTVVGYNPRQTAKYNLRPNLTLILTSEDLTLSLWLNRKANIRSPDRTDLTIFNSWHTTTILFSPLIVNIFDSSKQTIFYQKNDIW